MIKAEDLRIGDLVQHNSHILKVIGLHYIGAVSFYLFNEHFIVEENEVTPIPLTSEILEKNGFEIRKSKVWYPKFIGHSNGYILKYIYIERDENNSIEWNVFIKYDKDIRYANLRKIHYVHELQHILWALGEDANLKV